MIKFVEKKREEEERHIRENLTEEELELFDLLRKDKLTKNEEQQVKISAKKLYNSLIEKKNEILTVDWYKDKQPKTKVQDLVRDILNENLPQSNDWVIFKEKLEVVFNHILDRAMTGSDYIAT